MRDCIFSQRAVEGHAYSAVVAAASGKQQGSSLGCYCCGRGRRVKQCPMKSTDKVIAPKKASSKMKVVCFHCGSTKHLVKDCLEPPPSAGALDRQNFHLEDGD